MTNNTNPQYRQLPPAEQYDLLSDDCREIEESIRETEANHINNSNKDNANRGNSISVKGICNMDSQEYGVDDFPEDKAEVVIHLSIALDDENNLIWYQKLARERRSDFLKNCLKETLKAFREGRIVKTKAAFFAGVVKNKTLQQERIIQYKKKHYKHTTLVGYGRNKNDK